MKTILATLVLSSLLLTSACGGRSGFSTAGAGADGTSQGQGTGGNNSETPGASTPTWEKVEMNGYPAGGNYDGRLVIYIDKQNQSLLMVLPIPVLIPIIAQVPIPDLEGAYLTSHEDSNGGKSLAINIPLRHIVREGKFMPDQKLPNGDPLPFVPAGELPGFAIEFPQMPKYQIHLYVGVNVAAAFVELPDFGLPFGWTSKVKNQSKTKVVGAIGYVPPKNNYDGGMYIAAQLPDDLARVIDELIRW